MIRAAASLLLLLALCACTPPAPGTGPAAAVRQPRQGVTFQPDAEGLAVLGRTQRIDFGRAPPGVKAALTRETGLRPQILSLAGCPRGIVERLQWGDLILTFSAQQFVGWQRDPAPAAGQPRVAGRAC